MSYPVTALVNHEQFSKLMQFCEENGIHVESVPTIPFKPAELSKEYKKPSQTYAWFCGAENLNREGNASEQSVYDTIIRYSSASNLTRANGSIRLDEPLQTALKTDRTNVYDHELLSLVSKVFIA
jgi:hypothetical protein